MNNSSTGFAILIITIALSVSPQSAGEIAAKVVKGFQEEMAKD